MDAFVELLKKKPPRLLSASALHTRIKLLEDAVRPAASDPILLAESQYTLRFRTLLFESVVRAYRTELQRRPSHCQKPPLPQPAASSSPSCTLLLLSDDLIRMVAHELCRPAAAVSLGSTAKGLRVPMQAALAQLKQQHHLARQLKQQHHLDGFLGGGTALWWNSVTGRLDALQN